MTRAHRSAGGDAGDHGAAWTAVTPPVRPVPWPVAAQHDGPQHDGPQHDGPRGEARNAPARAPGVGDVGRLTVGELATAADVRRVASSALLGGAAQARVREDLDLVARLSEPVADLVLGLARLDPATAGVVAGMIERFAAADRRRRPPAS